MYLAGTKNSWCITDIVRLQNSCHTAAWLVKIGWFIRQFPTSTDSQKLLKLKNSKPCHFGSIFHVIFFWLSFSNPALNASEIASLWCLIFLCVSHMSAAVSARREVVWWPERCALLSHLVRVYMHARAETSKLVGGLTNCPLSFSAEMKKCRWEIYDTSAALCRKDHALYFCTSFID